MNETSRVDPPDDVLARFSNAEGTVRRLFGQDPQFRELCTDYSDCVKALRQLRDQGMHRDDQIEQYTELRASLEQELLVKIAATRQTAGQPEEQP